MEAKLMAQPESDQPCSDSDIHGGTPGFTSNGPNEAHSRFGMSADYEAMTAWALRYLADKTPGMTKQKKVGKKFVTMNREELVEAFFAFDAKKGAQTLSGPRWEEMSLEALWDLAGKTPRTTKKAKRSGKSG